MIKNRNGFIKISVGEIGLFCKTVTIEMFALDRISLFDLATVFLVGERKEAQKTGVRNESYVRRNCFPHIC